MTAIDQVRMAPDAAALGAQLFSWLGSLISCGHIGAFAAGFDSGGSE